MNKKNLSPTNSSKQGSTYVLSYLTFAILMIILGCSDAGRGVFAPVFQAHFVLDATRLSAIITVSYIGNLVFMLFGGRLADSFGINRVFAGSIISWMGALGIYLLTDSYYALLLGVFFAMGASTLLNILMNIMTPSLFLAPGMVINTLFFIQGIGTTLTQSVVGSRVEELADWKVFNLLLICLGVGALVLFGILTGRMKGQFVTESAGVVQGSGPVGGPESVQESGTDRGSLVGVSAFWLFIFIFGFYFVGEHGVMNWMNLYSRDYLGMSGSQAALLPSLFFGGITVGRLLFAPVVSKLGIRRSLGIFLAGGTLLYVAAFLIGGKGLFLFLPAGLGYSIIYPTMTMCIQQYFSKEVTTTASGTIMSIATLFDIFFNGVFGKVIDSVGYGKGMVILPVSMVLCLLLYGVLLWRGKVVRAV